MAVLPNAILAVRKNIQIVIRPIVITKPSGASSLNSLDEVPFQAMKLYTSVVAEPIHAKIEYILVEGLTEITLNVPDEERFNARPQCNMKIKQTTNPR